MKIVTIVGSGLTGATAARILTDHGVPVCVLEKSTYVGGNIRTELKHGVHVHMYGPHIFHTSNEIVWEFVNRFCTWKPFVYAPVAISEIGNLPLPVTMATMRKIYENATDEKIRRYHDKELAQFKDLTVLSQQDQWLKMVGRKVYELIFRHYSTRQWGVDPSQLLPTLGNRVPVNLDTDVSNYFPNDKYQAIPVEGYTRLIERLLEKSRVLLGIDWHKESRPTVNGPTIYTGMLDELFDYDLGKLPYRSLEYDHRLSHSLASGTFACVYNHTTRLVGYNREIVHYRFLHDKPPEDVFDYSVETCHAYNGNNIPMYPMPTKSAQVLAREYRERARELNIHIGGRLGGYKYINMDAAILEGMRLAEQVYEAL